MRARAVYRFFRAESEGNAVRLFEPGASDAAVELSFQRQPGPEGLCLADFVSPVGGAPDSLCLFLTTAGEGVRERAEAYKERGDYLKSHLIQALALETAEAFAELQESTSGEFGGLGIEVGTEDGFVKVVSPIEDTPAARAGVDA